MTKSKLKERSSREIRSKDKTPQIQHVPEFVSLIRDNWQEQIAQLESVRFSSLEELVEHFVASVAARMGDIPDLESKKNFLRELILQDEMLSRELGVLFSVSKKGAN